MNSLFKALGGRLPQQLETQPSAPVSPGSPGLDTGSIFDALKTQQPAPGTMVAAGPTPNPTKVNDFLSGFKGVR